MNANTDKMIKDLKKQAKQSIEKLANGANPEELAKSIYLSLEGKTAEIADVMIDNFKNEIAAYHRNVQRCLENSPKFIKEKLESKASEFETAAERCAYYHRVCVAVKARNVAAAESKEAANTYYNNNRDLSITEEEAKAKEANYLEAAVKAIDNDNSVAAEITDTIGNNLTPEQEAVVADFTDNPDYNNDLELILTSQAYVNMVNGKYEGINPNDVSIPMVVNTVCGGLEAASVAAKVETGEIEDESLIMSKIRAIGKVIGLAGYLFVVFKVAAYFVGFLTIIEAGSFIGCILYTTLISVLYLVSYGREHSHVFKEISGEASVYSAEFIGWLAKKMFHCTVKFAKFVSWCFTTVIKAYRSEGKDTEETKATTEAAADNEAETAKAQETEEEDVRASVTTPQAELA